VHPLLVPGAWLLEGNYFPAGKSAQRVTGVTHVHAADEFPETLRVDGEIRDADDSESRPVLTTFHLEVVSRRAVRFRMDSIPLATVLTGQGFNDDFALVLHYSSPDQRIAGFESYVACGANEMRTAGVLVADGVRVTSWHARLERVVGRQGR